MRLILSAQAGLSVRLNRLCYFLKPLFFILLTLSSLVAAAAHSADRLAPELKQQALLPEQSESAEILYSNHRLQWLDDQHISQTHYYSVRLLDEAAVEAYQELAFTYNSDLEKLEFEFAGILPADAEPLDINLSEQTLLSDFVQPDTKKIVSLNRPEANKKLTLFVRQLTVGSILEFQYRVVSKLSHYPGQFKTRVSPYWLQSFKVGSKGPESIRLDSVQNYEVQLKLSKGQQMRWQLQGGHSQVIPASASSPDIKVYHWQMSDLKSLPVHAYLPSNETFLTQIEFFITEDMPNGSSASSKAIGVDRMAAADPKRLKDFIETLKLTQLFQQAQADKAKVIEAIFDYIRTQIAYQPESLSTNHFSARDTDNLIGSRYGNDKDLAALLITILAQFDIEAYLAWVDLDNYQLIQNQIDTKSEISMLAEFDQAIVYLPAQDGREARWVNLASDFIFPGVDNKWVGLTVAVSTNASLTQSLLQAGSTGVEQVRLQSIQIAELDPNLADIRLDYLPVSAEQRQVILKMRAQGGIEQKLREIIRQDNLVLSEQTQLESILSSLFSEQAEFELDYLIKHLDSNLKPVEIEATYTIDQATLSYSVGANVAQMFNLVSPFEQLPPREQTSAGFIDRNELAIKMSVALKGYPLKVASLYQHSLSQLNPYFSLQQSGQAVGESHQDYLIEFSYRQPLLNLTGSDYSNFLTEVHNLAKLDSWLVSFRTNPKRLADEQLKQAVHRLGENSSQALLEQAEFVLSRGNFEQALNLATQIVQQEPENAQAWYIVATSAGLIGKTQQSEVAFEKAIELGFELAGE